MSGARFTPPALGILLVATATVLAGCTGGDGATDLEGLAEATVRVTSPVTVFEPGAPAPAEIAASAAGFVVSADGLAITTNDAVVGAASPAVTPAGATEPVGATVLATSECLDLAAVRLDGDERPFLGWRRGAVGDDVEAHVGSFAETSGEYAMSTGAVTEVSGGWDAASAAFPEALRLGTAVESASAGAPVVDADGRLMGVAFPDAADPATGVVLAGSVVREFVDAVDAGESVPSLGVGLRGWVSADGSVAGAWVRAVQAGGPAAAAGIASGDVIVRLGGVDVGSGGTIGGYCRVLRAQESVAGLEVRVYRPSSDQLLAGRIGSDPLAVVSTAAYNRSGAFTTVSDETGVLRVDVPVEWAQVDGAGFTDSSGNRWYSLTAAPDLGAYDSAFTEPGVQVAATAQGGSAGELLTALSGSFDASCSPLDAFVPYDDGVYAGAYSRWDCDGSLAIVVSTRNARGNNVAVIAQLRIPFDQDQTLQRILSTFQVGR